MFGIDVCDTSNNQEVKRNKNHQDSAKNSCSKKIRPEAHRKQVQEVKKNPKVTSRTLQTIFEEAGTCVAKKTVQTHLNNDGFKWKAFKM